MSKSTQIKQPVVHKKEKIQHTEKAWEQEHGHHIEANETRSKLRLDRHFPGRKWNIQLEKRKGPKI